MNERNYIALSILAGAVVGGIAGFVFFTERGRRLRVELQPHLDEMAHEIRNIQDLATRVRETATEGWRQVESFVGEIGQARGSWAGDTHRH